MSGDDQKYNFVQLPRFLSWRLLVPSLTVYGGIYAYERLTWTERSKEQAIKSQVIIHACTVIIQTVVNAACFLHYYYGGFQVGWQKLKVGVCSQPLH